MELAGTTWIFAVGDRVFHDPRSATATSCGRQQAHHPVRQGRREAGGGQLCEADVRMDMLLSFASITIVEILLEWTSCDGFHNCELLEDKAYGPEG
jgi:hypothetical protein